MRRSRSGGQYDYPKVLNPERNHPSKGRDVYSESTQNAPDMKTARNVDFSTFPGYLPSGEGGI